MSKKANIVDMSATNTCSNTNTCKSQRKMNYTRQNQNSLDSLACVTMLDEMKDSG